MRLRDRDRNQDRRSAVASGTPLFFCAVLCLLVLQVGIDARAQAIAVQAAIPLAPPPKTPTDRVDVEAPRPDPSGPVLLLANGDFLNGDVQDSPRAGTVRWQGKDFTGPFEFPVSAIASVQRPAPTRPPRPVGDYRFELAGGDVLYGALVGLDDEVLICDAPPFGVLHFERGGVRRIVRRKIDSDLLYIGPNGLAGWREVSTHKGWREEAGGIASENDGTTIVGDFGIPARSVIEFEISWRKRLDFVFALGVDDSETSARRAFRFEAWGGDLIVQRELDDEADLAIVGELPPGPGRIHLLAFLDQEDERITILSPAGKLLADLKFPAAERADGDRPTPRPKGLPGLRLTNIRGDLRLESLRISRWDGRPAAGTAADGARIDRADGSTARGRVVRYDAGARAFVVRDDAGAESSVPADSIADVIPSPPGGDAAEKPRSIRVIRHDGSRISGALAGIENGAVRLISPGIQEELKIPIASVRSILILNPGTTPGAGVSAASTDSTRSTPIGTLELAGVRLSGQLADAREQEGASCLAWRPTGLESAVPLRPATAGRIVYRIPQPPNSSAPARPASPAPPRAAVPAVIEAFAAALLGSKERKGAKSAPPSKKLMNMYLRTGDTIPCEVTGIDEAGISFKTPLSDASFIPHNQVKVVDLAAEEPGATRLTRSKYDRLLTLPRIQKGSPPTHLIRSRDGDYLRGRILKMDARTLEVEVRLEPRKLPRDRIARIIWLHADELESAPPGGKPAPNAKSALLEAKSPAEPKQKPTAKAGQGGIRTQIVRGDGSRLTFHADSCSNGVLSGTSDVLGAVRAPIAEADLIHIGGAIERAAEHLAFQQWKLHNAPEPRDSPGTGGGGSEDSGRESALVGKPAPPLILDLIDGGKFELAQSKGKVVVLDFWATWCGPCMQTMPLVDRVVREVQEMNPDVRLIAVNLQEPADRIKPVLERHKLELTVALDRDGGAADRYGATAIPQTVVIGRDGTISRLFIGGGPHFEEQFRAALREVVDGKPMEPAVPTPDSR